MRGSASRGTIHATERGGALDVTIDPVAAPSAYQSLLLGLLGADDPADESHEMTFRLAAGHNRMHIAQARDTLAALRGSQEVN